MLLYALDRDFIVKKRPTILTLHLECERLFRYMIDVHNDLVEEGLIANQKKLEYRWFTHPYLCSSVKYSELIEFLGVKNIIDNRETLEEILWKKMAREHREIIARYHNSSKTAQKVTFEQFVNNLWDKNRLLPPNERLKWVDDVFKSIFYEIERNEFVTMEELKDKFIITSGIPLSDLVAFHGLIRFGSPFDICSIEQPETEQTGAALIVEDGTKVLL